MSTRMSTQAVFDHQVFWRITEEYPAVPFRRNLHPVWVLCLSGKLGRTPSHTARVRVKQALFQLSYDPDARDFNSLGVSKDALFSCFRTARQTKWRGLASGICALISSRTMKLQRLYGPLRSDALSTSRKL